MPTVQLISATLETIGKPKPSKYEGKPDYRPCLFKLPDGSQRWKSYAVDAPELTWLQVGEVYQATVAGDEFNIVQPTSTAAAPTAAEQPANTQNQEGLSNQQKRAIAAYIEQMADLLKFCRDTAEKKLGHVDEETLRTATASLFISAQKKFNI